MPRQFLLKSFYILSFRIRMNVPAVLVYIATVIVGVVTATTALVPAREEVVVPKSCTMERVFKMVGYDCADMNLKEVPQYLRTNLQVSVELKEFRRRFSEVTWKNMFPLVSDSSKSRFAVRI